MNTNFNLSREHIMKKTLSLLALVALCANSTLLLAGDAAAGKAKSATCAACHGPDGISTNDLWPNLAGQKEGYLIAQMKAFRDGQRSNPMMAPMMAPLSDTDIEDLAAYYSSLGN
jgi:cytochrome c553